MSSTSATAVDLHVLATPVVGLHADRHGGSIRARCALRPMWVGGDDDAALRVDAARHRGELRHAVGPVGYEQAAVTGAQELDERRRGPPCGRSRTSWPWPSPVAFGHAVGMGMRGRTRTSIIVVSSPDYALRPGLRHHPHGERSPAARSCWWEEGEGPRRGARVRAAATSSRAHVGDPDRRSWPPTPAASPPRGQRHRPPVGLLVASVDGGPWSPSRGSSCLVGQAQSDRFGDRRRRTDRRSLREGDGHPTRWLISVSWRPACMTRGDALPGRHAGTTEVEVPVPAGGARRSRRGRLVTPRWNDLVASRSRWRRCLREWSPVGGPDLAGEAERLTWARRHVVVPEAVALGHDDDGAWLITRRGRGRTWSPRWMPISTVVAAMDRRSLDRGRRDRGKGWVRSTTCCCSTAARGRGRC